VIDMCEHHGQFGKGWSGWPALPKSAPSMPTGEWLDLTHPTGPQTPRIPGFPPPGIQKLKSLPSDPINVSSLQLVTHTGTHVDSPRHFFLDGPAFEDVPLSKLSGLGVVWNIKARAEELIEPEHFERATPAVHPGDIVTLFTGWAAHVASDLYDRHPSLSAAAAKWLVKKQVKLLAIDFGTPDLPTHLHPEGFVWPIHQILLQKGVLICEHLTGHESLAGSRAEFFFGALNIEGGDGAPARVVARSVRD
jgi:arylformamidase